MKWLIFLLGICVFSVTVYAEEPEELYAHSAVLMDAESGRVLFEKNGFEQKAMASTTKIMTCILALENGDLDDVVTFSELAASQPKVHLGVSEGKQFYLRDLLYSLMLESHNDSAVAIAEHIGGSIEGFAAMMNKKALELGCEATHYVTPNGLDASDEKGNHVTTAEELAKIMSYCILESEKAEQFLYITQTMSYSFTDIEGLVNYSCNNHNNFLNMMDGAISGKTGYTSKAGYCYVGALERDGRTFVVALLACGWPNHKDYKWQDTKELMEYAIDNYEYREVYEEVNLPSIDVENGVPNNQELFGESYAELEIHNDDEFLEILLGKEEKINVVADYDTSLIAPVNAGEQIGTVTYYLGEEIVKEYPIVTVNSIKEKDMKWYFCEIVEKYLEMA